MNDNHKIFLLGQGCNHEHVAVLSLSYFYAGRFQALYFSIQYLHSKRTKSIENKYKSQEENSIWCNEAFLPLRLSPWREIFHARMHHLCNQKIVETLNYFVPQKTHMPRKTRRRRRSKFASPSDKNIYFNLHLDISSDMKDATAIYLLLESEYRHMAHTDMEKPTQK